MSSVERAHPIRKLVDVVRARDEAPRGGVPPVRRIGTATDRQDRRPILQRHAKHTRCIDAGWGGARAGLSAPPGGCPRAEDGAMPPIPTMNRPAEHLNLKRW